MMQFALITIFLLAAEISTVAGTGNPDRNLDQGEATQFNIGSPFGVEIGPDGALYITEVDNHRVLRLDLDSGMVTTVAGNGTKGYSGDGGLATEAQLNEPYEVRFDKAGHMYFVEMQNHIIRRVDAKTKIITTIAGTGEDGFSGDGGPATKATFRQPHSIVLDDQQGIYVADIGNHRVRRIDLKTGVVDTIAGNGEKVLPKEGQIALGNPILGPRALYFQENTLWIALREGHSIWKLDLHDGKLQHVAGTGKQGFAGDGGAAERAEFNGPKGISIGPDGNVYVVDTENQAIRKIDLTTNNISTIAGMGPQASGFGGDGGEATKAKLARPHGICVDNEGRIYIGDTLNNRVRGVR